MAVLRRFKCSDDVVAAMLLAFVVQSKSIAAEAASTVNLVMRGQAGAPSSAS
jgi:hypothetical protein